VLATETVRLLDPRPGDVAVDCTVGRGGHAVLLAEAVRGGDSGRVGRVVGLDLDQECQDHARRRVEATGVPYVAVHDSFVRVGYHLRRLELAADVLLADLGFSSPQMDDPSRGFSFGADGPLDMRFDRRQPVTAADLLASLGPNELTDIIRRYGEDPLAAKIARNLVRARRIRPIETTGELARLVLEAYGPRAAASRLHPATRTFMALRIAVNDELGSLGALLEDIAGQVASGPPRDRWLSPEARVAIISFHSLEDRLVKRAFRDLCRSDRSTALTGRPVMASAEQRHANPRARSARLRAIRLDPARTADDRPAL
jgi:16S rRNA (cytosine1402-N4)-methyltransferase